MKCAYCKKDAELCKTAKVNNIPEPRPCKECAMKIARGEDIAVEPLLWLAQVARDCPDQIGQLLDNIKKEYGI